MELPVPGTTQNPAAGHRVSPRAKEGRSRAGRATEQAMLHLQAGNCPAGGSGLFCPSPQSARASPLGGHCPRAPGREICMITGMNVPVVPSQRSPRVRLAALPGRGCRGSAAGLTPPAAGSPLSSLSLRDRVLCIPGGCSITCLPHGYTSLATELPAEFTESRNHLGWKIPLGSSSPTANPTLPSHHPPSRAKSDPEAAQHTLPAVI